MIWSFSCVGRPNLVRDHDHLGHRVQLARAAEPCSSPALFLAQGLAGDGPPRQPFQLQSVTHPSAVVALRLRPHDRPFLGLVQASWLPRAPLARLVGLTVR